MSTFENENREENVYFSWLLQMQLRNPRSCENQATEILDFVKYVFCMLAGIKVAVMLE